MKERYTVKQISNLAGISIRTLHYYDEIDLLKPAWVGENNYRYYDAKSLLRLQQILLYRDIGFDLTQIKNVLDSSSFDLVSALQTHRGILHEKIERLNTLIQTIDITIHHAIGEINMSKKRIFQGFSKEKQKKYEEEMTEQWGDRVTESVKLWNSYSQERQQEILDEGETVYAEIAAHMDKGAESAAIQTLLVRWHNHLRHFYEPSIETLGGLGNMYDDHPDFNATFTAVHPDLPGFLKQAIAHYVECAGNTLA
ncbi:MAG: DNA-binding transcriptional MerR regulator [Cellvibrionaceae bacterium]|jgi:DNA-binding transcriptional MerR regulator